MTAPATPPAPHTRVRPDDLRALLNAPYDEACLVLQEGQLQVLPPEQDVGLVVITCGDLVEQLGDTPEDTAVEERAAELDSTISQLGS